jgi:hypothetical protein
LCPVAAGNCRNDVRRYCLADNRPRKRKIWNGMRVLGAPKSIGGDGVKTAWQMGWRATDPEDQGVELPCDLHRMGSGDASSNLVYACNQGIQNNPSYFEIYTMDLRDPGVRVAVLYCGTVTPPTGGPQFCPVPAPDCHKEITAGDCCPRCLEWDCDLVCDRECG